MANYDKNMFEASCCINQLMTIYLALLSVITNEQLNEPNLTFK